MPTEAGRPMRDFAVKLIALRVALMRMATRLRTTPPSMIVFQFASWLTYFLWMVAGAPDAVENMGIVYWLRMELPGTLPVPIFLILSLRLGTKSATDAVDRPLRFFAILVLAAIMAQSAVIAIALIRGVLPYLLASTNGLTPFAVLAGVLHIMVLGGTFSWLSLLYLRNAEDQATLSAQLIRKSMLARKVAQSRLLAARAQIDPEMVARVLRAVRERHDTDADHAFVLLDHLISYLRLAMNRVREKKPNLAAELALIRSYLALRDAETGVSVEPRMEFDVQASYWPESPPPLFLVVRKLFDAVVPSLPSVVVLHIDMQSKKLSLTLETGAVSIAEHRLERVEASLSELLGDNANMLHHSFESGVNRYVVSITSE